MGTSTASARLLAVQRRQLEQLREAVARRVAAEWASAGYDGAAIGRTVDLVLAGQSAVVAQVDAALSAAAGTVNGTSTAPLGLDATRLIGQRARNGTMLETVYGRPVLVASSDGPVAAARYVQSQVLLDLQLALREASHAHVMADQRVVGWRRQVNPAGGKTCGFCVAASTRIYQKINRMALHHHCRCSVVEIYATDPLRGRVIDTERLNAVYARSGGRTDRASLGAIRFDDADLPAGLDTDAIAAMRALNPRVIEHPELGEYLTGDRHDTEFDLAA